MLLLLLPAMAADLTVRIDVDSEHVVDARFHDAPSGHAGIDFNADGREFRFGITVVPLDPAQTIFNMTLGGVAGDGPETMLAQPQVISMAGQEAVFQFSDPAGSTFAFRVRLK
jgi:hypothetical protein